MNSFKRILVALLVATLTIGAASARFGIGPKVGMNINTLKFDQSALEASNTAGFNAGLMVDFTVPIIGLGFDLSAMYVHRGNSIDLKNIENNLDKANDYIEIPLNLKWKFSLPLVKPFLTTGPSVAFLTSKKAIQAAYKNKEVDWAWNVGAGVEVLGHIQVAASYGFGLTKALKYMGPLAPNVTSTGNVEGKNRYWTVTAAYLF